ncbi:MAG: rRNA maturation RNase YbeY [Maribacter sp.]|uniref:rRNA maturation RNase YbeY n=1 Tax=Maribacter sp. TaxID=1897614 RepID=UPI003C73E9E8
MIELFYECDFSIKDVDKYVDWIGRVLKSEDSETGVMNYIFCDDDYLIKINKSYLNHDTLTDIITFDYSDKGIVHGDIFISIERVRENAMSYKDTFEGELLRVMAHGLLHLVGYNDKTPQETALMRRKEEEKIKMFHVEQSEGYV